MEVEKAMRGVYIGIAMMVFLHGYMKCVNCHVGCLSAKCLGSRYTQPLFIQSLMGLKNLYDSKLVSLYIMGKPAEGDLKRPFKGAGGLMGGEYSALDNVCASC